MSENCFNPWPADVDPFDETPKELRPPIGAVVQWHDDYTGIVIQHHPTRPNWFRVYWHKWSNKADNDTLTGWEYDMHNCKVITQPVPGQWWPRGGHDDDHEAERRAERRAEDYITGFDRENYE